MTLTIEQSKAYLRADIERVHALAGAEAAGASMTRTNLQVTIPSDSVDSWRSQACQYSPTGTPGIEYQRYVVTDFGPDAISECLLFRDADGDLRGVLNYFPNNIPFKKGTPAWERCGRQWIEKAGNFNVLVDPSYQRRGVGTTLLRAATERWEIDFGQQDYTLEGALLVTSFLERGAVEAVLS